jgi:hypothetical protein
MTQGKGASGLMPKRDKQRPPIDHLREPPAGLTELVKDGEAQRPTSHVVAPSRSRRWIWLVALATTGVLVLGIVASLSGSDSEQAGESPQARSNVAEEPLGSDRHLENQGARMRAEAGAVDGSDRHLENQGARMRAEAGAVDGSDRHLENQATRAAPGAI